MANDRNDKLDDQEEGEYHFSDDQLNYEMEDVPAPEEPKVEGAKNTSLSKSANIRRYVLGGGAFVFLIFIVYKMMFPAVAPPTTVITQATSVAPTSKPTAAMLAQQPKAAPAQPSIPVTTYTMQSPPTTVPVASSPLIAQPVAAQSPALPAATMQQSTMASQVPLANSMSPPSSSAMTAMQAPTSSDAKMIIDKLMLLEQQNSKLSNTLDTEYAQKFVSYEAQNTALQAKVQDLSTRMASLEAGLTQLTQLLQGQAGPQVVSSPLTTSTISQVAPPKQIEPKIIYTVQAIIPGRAWLKSDAGDTVTVAEGDIIRSFGKVIKLDPYDGIVEVDTGTKVITLTYGGGSTT